MSEPSRTQENHDSAVDVRAVFALILPVVVTTVFWASHQRKPASTVQRP